MAYRLIIHAGGYWSDDEMYIGGAIHRSEQHNQWQMTKKKIMLMVVAEGYGENMELFSYFESGIEGTGKKNLISDEDFEEWSRSLAGKNVRHVYVVRSDDPTLQGFLIDDNALAVDGGSDGESDDESDDESDAENDDESESDSDVETRGIMYFSDNDEHDGDCSSFHKDQIFEDKESIKRAIVKYAVREKRNIKFDKSEETKVSAICNEDDCKWRIYTSINSSSKGKFVVRTLNDEHKCSWSGKVKLYTAREIANDFVSEFKYNPMTGRVIKSKLADVRINVSKSKCQRAREICGKIIEDQYSEQFVRMYDYVLELRESNPGSTIILGTQAQVFEKFYACFYAQKHGWKKACRRIIHLDGTHLKGRMKGQLLSAIGRDANDEMYPIAWAIVDVENKVNWEWFLENLRDDLELGMGNGTTLVSDQQKGLVGAIALVCPYVEHRNCAWHVLGNFRKDHGESPYIKKAFWRLAHAYNTQEYENALNYMKSISMKAHADIQKHARHWSRAFLSEDIKSDVVVNNMSESFNHVISNERYKHVMVLLEFVRQYVMEHNAKKLAEIRKYNGALTPRVKAQLEVRKRIAFDCQACPAGKGNFEVDQGWRKYKVNARGAISCSCRQYEMSGIPCAHLIKALRDDNKANKPEDFVSDWFSKSRWEECYEECLKPVNGINMWRRSEDVKVLPPLHKIKKGKKPGNKRKRAEWEMKPTHKKKVKFQKTCSNCGIPGHNQRTCKNEQAASSSKAPKRGPGRPRKNV